MQRRLATTTTTLLSMFVLALCSLEQAAAQQKPLVNPTDYRMWESLGVTRVSPDGSWLAYTLGRVEDDGELRIRQVARDDTRVVPLGDRPAFSADSRWLAYGIETPENEGDEGGEDPPARRKAVLLDLRNGDERVFESVVDFTFDPEARALVLNGYAPEPAGEDGATPGGAEIRIVDLETDDVVSFGGVAQFAWSPSESLLALRRSTAEPGGNGVQLWNQRSGVLRGLDASSARYTGPVWREEGLDLAVLRSVDPGDSVGAQHVVAWRDLDRGLSAPIVLDLETTSGMPEGHFVAGTRLPQWVAGGSMISVGLRAVAEEEEEEEEEEGEDGEDADRPEPADVQIWHPSDVLIYPQQQSRLSADRRRSLLAVWHLDEDRIVRLSSDLAHDVSITEDGRYGIERDQSPYGWGRMFGRPYRDVYRINAESGERNRVHERIRYSYVSTGGRYLLTFDGTDYWSLELASGERFNVTAGLGGTFANTGYDTPTDMLPPHGVSGWIEGDEAVLLNDEFDVWRVELDGSGGKRLTRGAEDEIVHRRVNLGEDGDAIDPLRPVFLSLRGKWTKQEGYARLDLRGGLDPLILESHGVRSLQKADSADVYLIRMQSANDSPDLFRVGADFENPRQLTATNPFQGEFAWPHSELVDFRSETGIRLQAALRYPANYDPGRRYPMIVHTYEIVSTRLHDYTIPSERSYYNDMVWQQAGYFVLRPDIVFRARDPGVSTVEALRPAVAEIVQRGLVNPNRVGLIGHSWGGYEAVFVPTRTNTFAASVSGAALTDFVSMMGAIHWNSGLPEAGHWETGQARMEVPFWEDPEAHRRNSPIHKVHELETPILMAFGDQDGTVDYYQGTEFFNFARRAGKQVVLLVYEGENHGFRQRKNQADYQRRILEWFGHYLKGNPAPHWITDGIPVADQDNERERIAKKVVGGD